MNYLGEIVRHLSDHMKDREQANSWRKTILLIIGDIAKKNAAKPDCHLDEFQKNIVRAIGFSLKKTYIHFCFYKRLPQQT